MDRNINRTFAAPLPRRPGRSSDLFDHGMVITHPPIGGGGDPEPVDPGPLVVWAGHRMTNVFEAYDRETHTWDPDYLFPEQWMVHLEVAPHGSVLKGVASLQWRVESENGDFEPRIFDREPWMQPFVETNIPVSSPGPLRTSCLIRFDDGSEQVLTNSITIDDYLIVSIGDSYASGEGVPDRPGALGVGGGTACSMTTLSRMLDIPINMSRSPVWLEPRAHRSLASSPALAAELVEDSLRGQLVTFASVACSGATIGEGLLAPQHGWQRFGQIQEVEEMLHRPRDHRDRLSRPIDALLLSIGGNDVGFSFSLESMTKDKISLFFGLLGTFGVSRSEALAEIERRFDHLPDAYDQVADAIDRNLQPRSVLITEYPNALFDMADGTVGDGCGLFDVTGPTGLSRSDALTIHELGERLNEEIRAAARRNGWTVVGGMTQAFAGHGYCSGQSLYVAAEGSCRRQGDFEGTMHPNYDGQNAMAEQIAPLLESRLTDLNGSQWHPRTIQHPPPPATRHEGSDDREPIESDERRNTFVWDPNLGERGAWRRRRAGESDGSLQWDPNLGNGGAWRVRIIDE